MKKQNRKIRKAFTIIEFMLAMSFLAVLLIAISTLTVRILQIYQKGLALRAINESGKAIITDFESAVGSSVVRSNYANPTVTDPMSTDVSKSAVNEKKFEYFKPFYQEQTVGDTTVKEQLSGIFCTSSYAYIWNTAATIKAAREMRYSVSQEVLYNNYLANPGDTLDGETTYPSKGIAVLIDKDDGTKEMAFPKLARIPNNGDYCTHELPEDSGSTDYDTESPYDSDNSALDKGKKIEVSEDDYTELLYQDGDDSDLAVYDLVVTSAYQSNATNHILYNISLILGTVNGGININSSGDYCTGDKDESISDEFTKSGFEYCAINKFDFTVTQTGESSINN